MRRYVSLFVLTIMLVCGVMGCAPRLSGPTQPSGYFFTMIVSDSRIYLLVNPQSFEYLPDTAEVIVRVRNAQGQPVNGVPVSFQVEPAWARNASLMPRHAITRDGEARAVFRASTIGVVRIMVRVEDMTRETNIVVLPAPDTPKGI